MTLAVRIALMLMLLLYVQSQKGLYQIKPNPLTLLNRSAQVYQFQFNYAPNMDLNFVSQMQQLKKKGTSQERLSTIAKYHWEVPIFQPEFDKKAFPLLRTYFQQIGIKATVVELPQIPWDMLKYNDTYFKPHCDIHRPKNKTMIHIGTQILMPSKRYNQFQGGELRLFEGKQYTQVLPHETLWTYVILPRGMKHEVLKVNGIRLSYRRSFYIKHQQFPFFSQRTCNQKLPNSTRRLTISETENMKEEQLVKNTQEL